MDTREDTAASGTAFVAAYYQRTFGWPIEHRLGELLLSLGNGIVAVVLPAAPARQVAAILQRQGHATPVVETPSPLPAWAFLAESNGLVLASDELPVGVEVLDCPRRLALPSTAQRSRAARWVSPPNPRQRWLPLLAAVIAAARQVCPTHLPSTAPNQPAARRKLSRARFTGVR